jgi:protein-S-isoprenylcysteine O-methyltransferase Ste14
MPKFGKWTSVWGIVTILLIVETVFFFTIYLLYRNLLLEELSYLGWILLLLSVYFAIVPVYAFRKKAEVSKGKSYIHTKVIVDTGVFSVVRHPQYLSMLLVALGLILIVQHWLIFIFSVVSMILIYIGILKQDKILVRKFGDDYKQYMQKVPRTNFLLGILQLIKRKIIKAQ